MMLKLAQWLETMGLGWFAPIARLLAGDEPGRQVRALVAMIGPPAVACAAFLLIWSALAGSITTSIGTVPGPREVVKAAGGLIEEHKLERAKAVEFDKAQEERRAKFITQFPDKEWKDRKYSGKPTFLDQILTSLKTVFTGFVLASLIAVPIGVLCGASPRFYSAVNPLVQMFKPVSPLAWLPIVMIIVSAVSTSPDPWFEKSFISSAITVALCSLWPALINTAIGVASVEPDHINVARVLRLGWHQRLTKIVIPTALPYIFTGLRLSLGVGWMVLIAAEMLAQNPGLGKFVWDMFQNGSSQTLALIMVAVFTIGGIGFMLDRIMIVLQRLMSYGDSAAIR